MPIGNTPDMKGVYQEIFRTAPTGAFTLQHLITNSQLLNKSAPYDLLRFRNYHHYPIITMDILSYDDTFTTYVDVNFQKSFTTSYISSIYYTVNKNDGYVPVQEGINMQGGDIVVGFNFGVERKTYDYTVSVTFESVYNALASTPTTINAFVPAKTTTGGGDTGSADYQQGQFDGQTDAMQGLFYNETRYNPNPSQSYRDGYFQGYYSFEQLPSEW